MEKFRFTTARLIIRDMTTADLDQVANIWGNPEVSKYLADPYYKDGDDIRACFKMESLTIAKIGLMIFIL